MDHLQRLVAGWNSDLISVVILGMIATFDWVTEARHVPHLDWQCGVIGLETSIFLGEGLPC